ncbi:hypothetical protein D3C79_812470 [compost metagenome]
MRAETRLARQAQQLRVQAAAIAARKEHERLVGQGRHAHPGFATLRQRVSGIDHCHQWFAKQLDSIQALGQRQRPHQADFDRLVEQGIGHVAAAHLLEVQVHRREALAKGVNGLGDARIERRR